MKNIDIYKKLIIKKTNHKDKIKHIILSFFYGGLVCVLGEIILNIFLLNNDLKTSQILTSLVVIITTSILTGFGIYDKFGRVAYSAAIIPISGFSNASTSAGLDYKNEGFILGIYSNVLKLSGVVLTMASLVGVVFGIIKYLINL